MGPKINRSQSARQKSARKKSSRDLPDIPEVFKIVPVPTNKKIGCIATEDIPKGTLIFRGTYEINVDMDKTQSPQFATNILEAFNRLNPEKKTHYMSLHDSFKDFEEPDFLRIHSVESTIRNMKAEKTPGAETRAKTLRTIFGIFFTNNVNGGVCLTVRFNHACYANAEGYYGTDAILEVRTVKKVKKGQEICTNHSWDLTFMRPTAERKIMVMNRLGTICECESCTKDKSEKNKMYEKFHNLKNEFDKYANMPKKSYESLWEEVRLVKEMYKVAREDRQSLSYIFQNILTKGFDACRSGYMMADSWGQKGPKQRFNIEGANFARTASKVFSVVTGKSENELYSHYAQLLLERYEQK